MVLEDITNLYATAIVQSNTTIIEPELKYIVIFTEGDLAFVGADGESFTRTFPAVAAGGSYPFLFGPVRIRQVLATGTTLGDVDMLGLR